MDQANATRTFLKDDWSAARVELQDVQALWGGRRIFLAGSGHVTVERVQRGGAVNRHEFERGADSWTRLVNLFVDNDFLTIKPVDRPGIPDEAHPAIILVNAQGEKCEVSKWAGVKDERFDAIYSALLRFDTCLPHTD